MKPSMKQRQRILYVETARLVGGSSISLYELVRGLDPSRYEPVVLFYYDTPYVQKFRENGIRTLILHKDAPPTVAAAHAQRDIEQRLRRHGNWLGLAYRYSKEAYRVAQHDWPIARRIACLIKAEGIDLVHHNNSLRGNQSAILGARLAGTPQICHVRMLHPCPPFAHLTQRFIAAFIYISQAVEQSYSAWGIPADRGRVIHNPFQLASMPDAADAAALRAELGLAPDDLVISNVGRICSWKGQDYFVRAMAAVAAAEPRAKALIVGAPNLTAPGEHAYYQDLQRLVHALGLADVVTFTGFRADIPQVMAAADLVVHSASAPEPFGRVIVEAMLAGRPIVATAAGGVLEIIEDRVTGLLVPPKDADAMAVAITSLLQQPTVAATMGATARQHAADRFTVEQHVQQVEALYAELCATVE